MAFELDHLFICASEGAPEAGRLVSLGLTEGAPNRHPGQGTANRRFFFKKAMIELLWLTDEREAQSDLIARTGLYERCRFRETGASPFGLCVRPGDSSVTGPPFECWDYLPPYLPEGFSIQVCSNSTLVQEPMLFYLPFRPKSSENLERRQPTDHALGLQEITGVLITQPSFESPSDGLSALIEMKLISIATGKDHLIEIEFDLGHEGQHADLRPDLPAVLRW
jgi:hypothetical protein